MSKLYNLESLSTLVLVMAFIASTSITHAQPTALPTATPQALGFSSERLKRLDDLMQQAVEQRRYGGIVILVARHGKVVYLKSQGKPNVTNPGAHDQDSIFRIASMTKPITGAAMMLLYEEGKWTPMEPLSRIIPEFSHLRVYKGLTELGEILMEDSEHSPTLDELMTHTAGFTYGWGSGPIDRLIQNKTENEFAVFEGGSLQTMIDRLSQVPLAYQPGSQWMYSLSVDIQGYLVEKLSGTTLPQFMKQRLFEPLGMSDTDFYVPLDKRSRFATLYQENPDGESMPVSVEPPFFGTDFTREPASPSGGAGLVSTAADYFRFAQMLLNGGELNGRRVLAPATVKLMLSNHLADALMAQSSARYRTNPRVGQGYGYDGGVVIDPGKAHVPLGPGSYFWAGGYGTWFWIDPVYGIVCVGMVQKVPLNDNSVDEALDLLDRFRAVTYQALVEPGR